MDHTDVGETSDRYEYDAPSYVTDLRDLEHADIEDGWFEQQAHLVTPLSQAARPHMDTEEDSAPSTSSSLPPNIVTSWGTAAPNQTDARPGKMTSGKRPAQPRRVSKRKEQTGVPVAPPVKKSRSTSAHLPARKSSSNPCRAVKLNSKVGLKTREATANTSTQPNSSEEMELERIRNLQKEVALHRKKNEASYKAALAGNPPPKKMALSTTVPKEFNFRTDTRVNTATASNTDHKEVDFINQLRKPSSSPAKAVSGTTVPKPFNLSRGNKRKIMEPSVYVPMAEQIVQFQRRTPDRYHLRSRRSQERGPSPGKGNHLKLTQPHTPCLMTRQRCRPSTLKSSAELEAEEVDQLHKFKFKALELNRKILDRTESLKKPAVKEPTIPEGFDLQIEKRLQERQASSKPQEAEENLYTFKSQPLPTKILEGVVGLPEKKVQHPTVPESPAFVLKNRVRLDTKVEEVKPPSPIKAAPVPHFGLPFNPRLPENHHVDVCPFSFEERERERKALKEKRLEEMRNEEAPSFKAQPLPDFDVVVLPEKQKLEPTKPEPFKLLLDERGAVKNSRWEQMVKEEQKQQVEAAIFKARPNTVTHKEPFQPKKENRIALGINSSTVAETFELSTERRARERQEYERQANEKEAIRACMEEEQRRQEELRDKEKVAKLRQEQVHKAQPVRRYKAVAVKRSEVPLTVPQSPNFSDRFRL
ncbi:targeting protein for Xklp2 isoform X2 [Genypterus blacodes]|uniref:targeting protein for Xklp2 isoform X2 n=1 Tax=Genypterus blacodes TaxID=154954 RepID=UPI003F765B33